MKNVLMMLAVALTTASIYVGTAMTTTSRRAVWTIRPGHPDVAPEFSCDVAHNGMIRHYSFSARGYAVLYVDGQYYNDSQKSRFVAAMYDSICNKLIYHR